MAWYFFKTLREKRSIIKKLRQGDVIPFFKYLLYRFRLSPLFHLHRKWYTMRVFYSPYAFWLWTHEEKEKDEEVFFESFLKKGDVVVDCGAHIGTLTITASKLVGDIGYVYAYEAHPRTYSYLSKNIDENNCSNVSIENCAIGDSVKETTISDSYVSDMNVIGIGGSISIQMKTLDMLLQDVGVVDLLKLDIEGSELLALKGGEQTLSKVKAIYFESAAASFERFNYSLKDIILFLEQKGFSCFSVSGGIVGDKLEEGHVTASRYENIIAFPL